MIRRAYARSALSLLMALAITWSHSLPASAHFDNDNGPSSNKFGIGLVSEGNTAQYDATLQLVGSGGWILLTFAGVDNTTTQPPTSWIDALNACYSRNLTVVVRLSPPWGQSHYRDESDDSNHTSYVALGNAFKSVVDALPLPPNGQPLYIQLDNEPNLCYEWFCQVSQSTPLSYQQTAAEYASFYRDAAAAIRSLSKSQIQLALAPLAPGGTIQCGCCGQSNCPQDKPGVTGLDFMKAMQQAVPNVFSLVDFLSTHSYPASGVGYGFNAPFDQAGPGLSYYQQELQVIGRALPVVVSETGWASHTQGLPPCSEQNKADWTVAAYKQYWLSDDNIVGVTPFMLQDPTWGDQDGYDYVLMSGQQQPVYQSVRSYRCSLSIAPNEC